MVNDAACDDSANNCFMTIVVVDKFPHLCIFAKRDIRTNEELRYDYGDPKLPWRKRVSTLFPRHHCQFQRMQRIRVIYSCASITSKIRNLLAQRANATVFYFIYLFFYIYLFSILLVLSKMLSKYLTKKMLGYPSVSFYHKLQCQLPRTNLLFYRGSVPVRSEMHGNRRVA